MTVRAFLVATGVVLAMSGCSHGASRPGAAPPSRPPGSADATASTGSTTTTPGVGDTAAGPATSVPTADTTAARPGGGAHCTTAGLMVTMTDLGAAAGTAFRELVFKNTSAETCTMEGYPAVSFVDAQGHQLGPPAERMNGAGGRVVVPPGAGAAALIAYHDVYVTTAPNCQPATAAGIRVYPPIETVPLSLTAGFLVCANQSAKGTAGVSPLTTPANVHP